jgi:hypothetical protein
MGTGGDSMPMVFSHTQGLDPQPSQDVSPTLRLRVAVWQSHTLSARMLRRAHFSATESDTSVALQAHQPSVQSHHAQMFVAQTFDTYNQTD